MKINTKDRQAMIDLRTGARLYTVREAARILDYHPFSVYRLICRGLLRHTRLGPKKLLLSREDLVHFQRRMDRQRPRRGKPLASAGGPTPVAQVFVDISKVNTFRWEKVPLIRARLGARSSGAFSGLRISVRGREGDAWRVVYEAPRGGVR